LGDAERALLKELLHQDPSKRPTAGQLLQHPLFRERPLLRKCCICFDDFPLASGLECALGGHFTCSGCLEQHALAFSKADVGTLQKTEAKLRCPKFPTECKEEAYTDAQIASTVP
jgi:serine/threonine protein kinase